MRVVLDTNILISALMSSASPSAQLLALWRTRKIALVTAAQQIEEIARVTRYPKIRTRIAPALSGRLVNRLRTVAVVVGKLPQLDVSPDPDDNYLLALAEAGHVQFLVTGDKMLLSLRHHKSTRIVTPAAMIEALKAQDNK
jgi:uncharacterized protein